MNEATHGKRPGDQTPQEGAPRGVGDNKDVKHVPLPDDVAEWMGMDQDAAPLAVALSETRREEEVDESEVDESAQANPQPDPEPTRAQ